MLDFQVKIRLEGSAGAREGSSAREYRAMSFIGGRPEAIEMDMESFDLLKVWGRRGAAGVVHVLMGGLAAGVGQGHLWQGDAVPLQAQR